jgi:hypothetical protein
MKKNTKLFTPFFNLSLLISIFIFVKCNKEETCNDGINNQEEVEVDCGGSCQPCAINYPTTGTYGVNLLYGSDTLWLPGTGNSFKAIVPEGSSLKIEMTLISGDPWLYTIGSNVGWSISSYSNQQQTFEILNPGTSDVEIYKDIDTGSSVILIKFFENSTTETRRKVVIFN